MNAREYRQMTLGENNIVHNVTLDKKVRKNFEKLDLVFNEFEETLEEFLPRGLPFDSVFGILEDAKFNIKRELVYEDARKKQKIALKKQHQMLNERARRGSSPAVYEEETEDYRLQVNEVEGPADLEALRNRKSTKVLEEEENQDSPEDINRKIEEFNSQQTQQKQQVNETKEDK